MSNPNVCVLNAAGINCNEETAHAFEIFGATPEQVHISQLADGSKNLSQFQILALPGGFSDSDAIQSGRTLGLELRNMLGEQLNQFIEEGGLALGICNGFQIMTELGILPDGEMHPTKLKSLSLIHNEHGKFVDNWQKLKVEKSKCLFVDPDKLEPQIELPVANGEGRLVAKDTERMAASLALRNLVVFRYCNEDGTIATEYPANPSGSLFGITGVCDQSGQVLGMMPHPERFVYNTQHPNWRRGEGEVPFGGLIIKQMVEVAKAA